MGMFKFLKKSKADMTDTGLELPPVPTMDNSGVFPEINEENTPDLPDTSLPPLPTELPGEIPPAPKTEEISTPTTNLPDVPNIDDTLPEGKGYLNAPIPPGQEKKEAEPIHPQDNDDMPTKKEIEEVMGNVETAMSGKSKPEFPSMPDHVSEDLVPDDIPPLEGIPEPPGFETEPATSAPYIPEQQHAVEAVVHEPEHPIYIAPDEPQETMRREVHGPRYIRSDRFKAVLEDIEHIKAKFKEEDEFFFRIKDIKSAQDQKFEEFRQTLEDVQRKLLFIDKTLFETR